MAEPLDLDRFVTAQAPIYETALAELKAGRKRTHWMWFVFPQLRGLGHSPSAQHYGIASRAEAEAYLAHPMLGSRLRECTAAVMGARAPSLRQFLGSPDDLKFRSSMTLFEAVADDGRLFADALDRWCGRERDEATLRLLANAGREEAE